ncbi:NADP-dependent oxidoreductase domain-containing protein [Hysterangium stoloniferum]|nr:NADP-dependent oxidoreductase domain-containing protein [Hysterangium stoloniferum]
MPWTNIKLNSGSEIPGIGFGTWKIPQPATVDQVDQAVVAGFNHIDTAQVYRNESETGQALRESGLPRTDLWLTTKYSGLKDVETSINDSLDFLGVSAVDLYLIHSPRLANGDIPGLWKKFEDIHARGLAKHIGVSNFNVADLKVLLKDAKIKPAVNQIIVHPYVYAQQKPTIDFCKEQGIAIEAYSPLIPVTQQPGGPVDTPLAAIAKRTGATFDQILLAWNKTKGTIVLTSSSKSSRLDGYRKAGDLVLTTQEIADIDAAGAGSAGSAIEMPSNLKAEAENPSKVAVEKLSIIDIDIEKAENERPCCKSQSSAAVTKKAAWILLATAAAGVVYWGPRVWRACA